MNKVPEKLKPLKRISPSRYTAMKKCPYRVVLANSYSAPLLPYPPASHLGNVIHECIRLIISGVIKTNAEFDKTWKYLLAKQEKALVDRGFEFYKPLSENVPGYTIKKLQVKSLLKSRGKTNIQENKKTSTSILTEKWLEAKDSLIGGYTDIIFNRNDYIKLSDFKSGGVFLEEGEIKEEYEDQLKLYAYLYSQVFGKYPDQLSIIDLEKKEYLVTFTPQGCEALADKAKEALSKINSLIEKNERRALAKPTWDHCKSCLYRPACSFYWQLPLSEGISTFRDVRGRVTAVNKFRNGNLNTTLNTCNGELIVSQVSGEYSSFLTDSIGKEVAFYNVMQSKRIRGYRAIKTTKVYEVS